MFKTRNLAEPLFDRFGRFHDYLRISLTERCNLRCQYCMPAEGIRLTVKPKLLTSDELKRLLSLFVELGTTKVRFTGGEPTLRKDLLDVISHVRSFNAIRSIGMTTNALVLRRPRLQSLMDAGLDQVNISLDTLVPAKFHFMTRISGFNRVWSCIDEAEQLFEDRKEMIKLNVVVMRHFNDDEITDFIKLTRDRRLDVRFIEYMPFGGNSWESKKLVSYAEILSIVREAFPLAEKLVNEASSTSKAYRLPGSKGQFGFITSMTNNFCGGCNRLRITADGNLKELQVCLHGTSEVSLRDVMRSGASDAEIVQVISSAVKRKRARHAGMFNLAEQENRPMTSIGG